ncbi:MAG TPA: ABC transporter permease [Candidatus Dormibacteraeota bacterium]|jgi:peptide/nickel transport system permease protein
MGGRFGSPLVVLWHGSHGRVGTVLVTVMLLMILFGPAVAPFPPNAIVSDILQGPSREHLLGTDVLGRDVLSRLLNGGRSILILPILAVAIAFVIGTTLGLLAGLKGGLTDVMITGAAEVALSIPALLMVLVLVFTFGHSDFVLVVSTGIFVSPRSIRIIRGAAHAVCSQDYVTAARARGEGDVAIVFREILPNVTGPLLAEFALRLTYAIGFISTLSFLGLGQQPPSSDWGLMVSDGRPYFTQAPLLVIVPALGIAALAIGINLIADEITSHLARNVQPTSN